MKKLLPLLVLIVIVIVGVIISQNNPMQSGEISKQGVTEKGGSETKSSAGSPVDSSQKGDLSVAGGAEDIDQEEEEGEESEIYQDKSAIELYKSSEEALDAVKKGAQDYDDTILDQFVNVSPACSWCDKFYASLKDSISSPESPPDQKSYFAELLAISGRVDNVSSLLELTKNAPNPESAEILSEALELTQGDDKVVSYLSEQLPSLNSNPTLQESVVAAVTNHGSKLAAETLYNLMVSKNDTDGYYSKGIGLSEIIPDSDDPDVYQFLQGVVLKRDQWSQHGVRAMLNGGEKGLKVVIDILSNSNNEDFDRAMIKDAKDHVPYDEASEQLLKATLERTNKAVVKEFIQSTLDGFEGQGIEDPNMQGIDINSDAFKLEDPDEVELGKK